MKVLVLAPSLYDTSPAQRFRIEQWARYLEKEGYEFTFVPFKDERLHNILHVPGKHIRKACELLRALVRRVAYLRKVKHFDVVFVPREATMIGPDIIEKFVSRMGIPLVYDFDDPIWIPYKSPTNNLFSRLKWQSKTASICKYADHVITGNKLIGEWAKQHSQIVDVVPSTVDMDRYKQKENYESSGKITLGWTGSHSTIPFLQLLKEPLCELGKKYDLRLLVISHTDEFQWDDVPVEIKSVKWSARTEAEDLLEMDIGLGPFPNEGWTPWRCHGKVLQYMAAGIPCVVSNIGILPEYIQEGRNGFLAESDSEWVEKISLLIEDVSLRKQLGNAGRETINQQYSSHVWVSKLSEIFKEAVQRSQEKRKKFHNTLS